MNSINQNKALSGDMPGPGDKDPRHELVQAAADGDLQTLQRLRGEYKDLNLDATDDQGRTALAEAISHGRLSVVEQLVQSGADIDLMVGGLRALHRAAVIGNLAMVQTLLDFGADINQESESRETPLMLAIQTGNISIASFLLSREGIQVNATSHVGDTALLKAVKLGNLELVRELVSSGAQIDLRVGRAESAFVCAFHMKDKAMMRELLDFGADINQVVSPHTGNTVLIEAVINGHLNKAQWLIAKGADLRRENIAGWTALRFAALNPKREKILRLLLVHGVELEDAALALDCAIRPETKPLRVLLEFIDFRGLSEDHQMQILISAVRLRSSEIYELLLQHGADPRLFQNRVNALDPKTEEAHAFFWNALSVAAWCGHVGILQALSRQGFDLMTPLNDLGENALHGAVKRGHQNVVEFLLSGDSAVEWANAKTNQGFGPLHFLEPGHLGMARFLLLRGANVNQGGEVVMTPLIWALLRNDEPLAGLLLDHGALCLPDQHHLRNPLHWAVVEGVSLDLAKRLRSEVHIDTRDCNRRTALMLSVKENRFDLASFLLDQGAQIDLQDDLGNTALHLAGAVEQKAIAQLLIAHGADVTLRNNAGVAADREGGRTAMGSPEPEDR